MRNMAYIYSILAIISLLCVSITESEIAEVLFLIGGIIYTAITMVELLKE